MRNADTEGLARELRRRLGAPPQLPEWPLVSLVVLNRDGAHHLRRFLTGLIKHTDYPRLELVLVDNGSSDDSVAFARAIEAPFPISIIANAHNESFSDACNQGAKLAAGELLLFANNDLEPFEDGWLRELVACQVRSGAGAVSATLVYHDDQTAAAPYGYLVQHRGMRFREENGMVCPVLRGYRDEPLDEQLGRDDFGAVVAAACVLVDRELFAKVGGSTHGYVYGAEDVDLCLKIRAAGREVACSGRSVVVHQPGSTRRTAATAVQRDRKLRNRRILWERWGPRIRREYDLDLLDGAGRWAELRPQRPEPPKPPPTRDVVLSTAFCLKAVADCAELAKSVAGALTGSGRRALVVSLEDERDDPRWLNCDVAIHLRGRSSFVPVPGQFNVLWHVTEAQEPSAVECARYELVLAGTEDLASRLRREVSAAVEHVDPESWSAQGVLGAIEEQLQRQCFATRIEGWR